MWNIVNIYHICKYCEILYNTRNTIMPVFPGKFTIFHNVSHVSNLVHFTVQHQFADAQCLTITQSRQSQCQWRRRWPRRPPRAAGPAVTIMVGSGSIVTAALERPGPGSLHIFLLQPRFSDSDCPSDGTWTESQWWSGSMLTMMIWVTNSRSELY